MRLSLLMTSRSKCILFSVKPPLTPRLTWAAAGNAAVIAMMATIVASLKDLTIERLLLLFISLCWFRAAPWLLIVKFVIISVVLIVINRFVDAKLRAKNHHYQMFQAILDER